MPDRKISEENINWKFYGDLFKKGIKDIKERFEILWEKDNDLKRIFETLLEKDSDFKQRYQTLLEMHSGLKEKEIYIHITMIFENIIKTIIFYYCVSHNKKVEFHDKSVIICEGLLDSPGQTLILIKSPESFYFHPEFYLDFPNSYQVDNILVIDLIFLEEDSRKGMKEKFRSELGDLISILHDRSKFEVWDLNQFLFKTLDYIKYISMYSKFFLQMAFKRVYCGDPKKEEIESRNIQECLLKEIKKKNPRDLVLCLGAGVSMSANLPDWNKLLEGLMIKVVESYRTDLDSASIEFFAKRIHTQESDNPLFEAEFIQSAIEEIFKDNFKEVFQDIIKQKLYERPIVYSELIETLSNLCGIGINKIINYNYDKTIFEKIKSDYNSVKIISDEISYEDYKNNPDEYKFNIFHVHGFLENPDSKIILSEIGYFTLFEYNSLWNNKIQLKFFGNNNCLLIGLSIKDPNLRRLLFKRVKRFQYLINKPNILPHYVFLKRIDKNVFFGGDISDGYGNGPSVENFLRMYYNLKEISYLRFGINVIWYEDHEDLPNILNQILKIILNQTLKIIHFKGVQIPQFQADFLQELEDQLGEQFNLVNKVERNTKMGFSVENNQIMGIGLHDCGISTLPESISNLKSLTYLNLKDNQLMTLSESISNLKSLTGLSLVYNQLTTLPESIGNLNSLKTLLLGINKLMTLPESIGNLSSLQTLSLSDNKLTTLPQSIGNLSSLQTLSLNDNKLTTLPESITKLTSLQILYLRNNKLTTLPKSIGKLKSLKTLLLGSNKLTTLPKSIGKLKSLKTLGLSDNKLITLPESIKILERRGVHIYK